MEFCQRIIKRPEVDTIRFRHVWEEQVYPLKDEYEMTP
jgi:hypothetical protein